MLFAAGMGIGLMFFGVLEPVYHMAFSEPIGVPKPFDADGNIIPENVAAAKAMGMAATIFTGACTPGRSTPWSHSLLRSSPSTRVCR